MEFRYVSYHASVTMAALWQYLQKVKSLANELQESIRRRVPQILSYLTAKQRADGSLPCSRGDYRVLSDQRSYPSYLAMILLHFLLSDL